MKSRSLLGNMSEGLLRQRRNLISVSCVLIFLKFAGVEVSKLTFLGIDFGELKNPSALYFGIWAVFSYFLFRYYQYFKQDGEKKLTSFFKFELDERVNARIRYLSQRESEHGKWIDNGISNSIGELKREKWVYFDAYSKSGSFLDRKEERVTIKRIFGVRERIKCSISTIIFLLLHTSAITDYILPFALALLTLVYSSYGSSSSLFEAVFHSFGSAS